MRGGRQNSKNEEQEGPRTVERGPQRAAEGKNEGVGFPDPKG